VTAAHQMKMDVENDLTAAVIDVRHQTKPTVGDAALVRQAIRHKGDRAHPDGVIGLDVQKGWHVPLRHDEQVDGSAWMNILNGQYDVILVEFDAGLSARDDVAKDTLSHQIIRHLMYAAASRRVEICLSYFFFFLTGFASPPAGSLTWAMASRNCFSASLSPNWRTTPRACW
jgi:hypothetical protein